MLAGLAKGHIVHYVISASDDFGRPGDIRPAIVIEDWAFLNREDGYANLGVFLDGRNDSRGGNNSNVLPVMIGWATSRIYSEHKQEGTWHWPHRA